MTFDPLNFLRLIVWYDMDIGYTKTGDIGYTYIIWLYSFIMSRVLLRRGAM